MVRRVSKIGRNEQSLDDGSAQNLGKKSRASTCEYRCGRAVPSPCWCPRWTRAENFEARKGWRRWGSGEDRLGGTAT